MKKRKKRETTKRTKKEHKERKIRKKEKRRKKKIPKGIKIDEKEVEKISEKIKKIKKEIGKVIVGQEKVIEGLICALICNGHIILEGVPGIAKTLLIRTLGEISGCDVKRIQFTVDLLPTDILGLTIYREKRGFELIKGPIFANFIIADEINRAPPKTQSSLLEAMQERQVTIGRKTFPLQKPFFVMATKNPIESVGIYTLPEAQLDRFLFKLIIKYPKKEEEKLIIKQNIELKNFDEFKLKQVVSIREIINMQKLVKKIYLSKELEDYIVEIVDYTRDRKNKYAKYLEWGASPRASIAFFIASKAKALMKGRNFVAPEDVKDVALEILRHRVILSYEAEANNITSDSLIREIINQIPMP
jgi:MoxR-like ATPase